MAGSRALRSAFRLAAIVAVLAHAAPLRADDTPLFRVILKDGTAVLSYGEFARVGDRLVFSMPIGLARPLRLQLVNLPLSAVNWESTAQYADAVRYARYVATRAEADFAVLTGQVAAALNDIAVTKDPARRLRIAQDTRRLLAGWPRDHYGYRSRDIREMDGLLEQAISELRAAAGEQTFDLSLVAMIEPPAMPTLPDPTPAQTIEQALIVARLSDVPAERLALLRGVLGVIEESGDAVPKEWARLARLSAKATLEHEIETERRYDDLSRKTMEAAAKAAARADVHGVEKVLRDVDRRDEDLGRLRPEAMSALVAALRAKLDATRRLRLMRDQWALRSAEFRAYQREIRSPVDRLARLQQELEEVRALAGPPVGELPGLAARAEQVARQLARVAPPAALSAAHATLLSAARLASEAMSVRRKATVTGDVTGAWNASAAAAGSILMLAQARQQIEIASRPPELR